MADDQDKSQKTEDPTAHRLSDAAKKGQVAKSQEVNHVFILTAIVFVLGFFAPDFARSILRTLRVFLESPHLIDMGERDLGAYLGLVAAEILFKMALPILILMTAAVSANLVQAKVVISAESMKPKLTKLSPIKGAVRMVSPKGLMEFVKGIFKISIVGLVVFSIIWPERDVLPQMMSVDLNQILMFVRTMVLRILVAVIIIMILVAMLDFKYQKYEHKKGLRMSKQDVKDEAKQTDGDPMVKARIRSLRLERGRQRMMQAVPEADVVITNPTHFAVVLKYESKSMEAPKLVAKGVDHLALRIREIAEENGIPVVENPPVARALYAAVEVDAEVPNEHYKAVAEIIGYVMKLKGVKAAQRYTAPRETAGSAGADAGA
ncbi:MAG: flagellar biosynthesis protein FlhB [Proteobacteria bacterium]|nr:flagellar biosynthesis protein FlhB [Pseudomonadota bacterium]